MKLKLPKIPTWFVEQIPVVLVLALEARALGGFDLSRGHVAFADVWLSALVALVGWKLRSIANRQREQNQLAGITDHRISCWKTAEDLAVIAQVLMMFRASMKAASVWSLVYAGMIVAYPYARKAYRKRWPARLEGEPPTSLIDTGCVRFWEAVNAYAVACGGDTSGKTIGGRRMDAVAFVMSALREILEQERNIWRTKLKTAYGPTVSVAEQLEAVALVLDEVGVRRDVSMADRVQLLANDLQSVEDERDDAISDLHDLRSCVRGVVGAVEVTEADHDEVAFAAPEDAERAAENAALQRGLRELVRPSEAVRAVARLVATQDNRITENPLFVVERQVRIYGVAEGYADAHTWLDDEHEEVAADGPDADEEAVTTDTLEQEYQATGDERDGYRRVGYRDRWEFVTATFTEAGCEEYIRLNKHNLGKTRIYVHGGYRNHEWQVMRQHLLNIVRGSTPAPTTAHA